jgi:hypothetical protein
MNRFKSIFIALLIIIGFAACKKGAGEGGRASIRGKVFARNYSNSFVQNDSGFIGGIKVYIKYGDQPGIGDNADTDQDGEFYFNYLREGKYTLIVYSKQLVNNALDSAVVKVVEITSRKEELIMPQININTFKN